MAPFMALRFSAVHRYGRDAVSDLVEDLVGHGGDGIVPAHGDLSRVHPSRRAASAAPADPPLHPRDHPAGAADRSRRARHPRQTSSGSGQDEGGRPVGARSARKVRRRRAGHLRHVGDPRGDVAAPHGLLQPGCGVFGATAAGDLRPGPRSRSRSTRSDGARGLADRSSPSPSPVAAPTPPAPFSAAR